MHATTCRPCFRTALIARLSPADALFRAEREAAASAGARACNPLAAPARLGICEWQISPGRAALPLRSAGFSILPKTTTSLLDCLRIFRPVARNSPLECEVLDVVTRHPELPPTSMQHTASHRTKTEADSLSGWGYRLMAPGKLAVERVCHDLSALGPTDIAIVAEYSAVSPGTEIAAWRGDPPLRPGNPYPRLVGYCHVGRVVATGNAVSTPRVGDRVLTHTAHCSVAVLPADGALAVLDEQLAGSAAALAYLFHLGYAAILRANVRPGQCVAIVGLGAIGLASVAVAALSGADVVVSARQAALDQAAAVGAHRCARSHETPSQIKSMAGRSGIDAVITTSNRWADWWLALDLVRKGGTVAVLGFPGRGEPPRTSTRSILAFSTTSN